MLGLRQYDLFNKPLSFFRFFKIKNFLTSVPKQNQLTTILYYSKLLNANNKPVKQAPSAKSIFICDKRKIKSLLSFRLSSFVYNANRNISSSSSTSLPKNSSDEDPKTTINKLDMKKSQRLMRLIYARVHPDLFTNHLEAQKLNEDSLKTLRNMIDYYSVTVTENSDENQSKIVNKFKYIEFYSKKNLEKDEIKLKKFRISFHPSFITVQDQLTNVFNQFIDHLKLSTQKFNGLESNQKNLFKLPSFLRQHSNYKYRVTYKNVKANFNDDEMLNDEEFQFWYEENEKKNLTPSLRKWINDNKIKINSRISEAEKIKNQLQTNMSVIIERWGLNDLIFNADWSLKYSNSYMLGLLNRETSSNFKGYTLVLTDRKHAGLQRNGHINLNCDMVYEEWLYILGFAKKETKLLPKISDMEQNLSLLLNQIKICDNIDQKSLAHIDYEGHINSAIYYNQMLNSILNRFTEELIENNTDRKKLIMKNDFLNLQLTIQNVKNIELNSMGQFVIGNSRRINHNETINFIKEKKSLSEKLYRNHIRSLTEEQKLLAETKNKLKMKEITFDDSLKFDQKTASMRELIKLAKRNNQVEREVLEMMKRVNLCIGTAYFINDDGSLKIPWNWFESENNNG